MTTGHVFIACSLDGFIAKPDGDISWLTPNGAEHEDHGYTAFFDSVDGIIMGRGTWEVVAGFEPWPYEKPVVVLSSTLTDADIAPELRDRVRIWAASPREALQRVDAEGWTRAYIDGGKLIQSCLAEGLIEDMILTRIPVLLGAGLPLFGAMSRDIALTHLRSESFASGLVQSHYLITPERKTP